MDTNLPDTIQTRDQTDILSSETASINLLFIQQEIGRRIATDPSLSMRQLIDAGEHSYKVSGLAKKQEPERDDNMFVYVIDMGDTQLRFENGLVVEHQKDVDRTIDVTPSQLVDSAADLFECPEFTSVGKELA